MVRTTAIKHNINLLKEFDPELEFLEADKQKVKQILFNLLSNAVKFSKSGVGSITITTKKYDEMVQISVSDTGIGIKKEDVGKLFKKFQQIENATYKKYGGTGLGLAISKELVELHGGRIWAESKYGEGSTFTFQIPIENKKGAVIL
jgi:signal transduction histidine kinase